MNKSFLFILSMAFALASCQNATQNTDGSTNADPAAQSVSPEVVNNPMTAADTKSEEKLPEFSFDNDAHDFGKTKQGDKVNYDFKFKNTGKGDLVITTASGSCGCTVPDWPKQPIKPGETGAIKVEFNSAGKQGMQRVTVTIIANTIPNTKVLTLTGEVVTQ